MLGCGRGLSPFGRLHHVLHFWSPWLEIWVPDVCNASSRLQQLAYRMARFWSMVVFLPTAQSLRTRVKLDVVEDVHKNCSDILVHGGKNGKEGPPHSSADAHAHIFIRGHFAASWLSKHNTASEIVTVSSLYDNLFRPERMLFSIPSSSRIYPRGNVHSQVGVSTSGVLSTLFRSH